MRLLLDTHVLLWAAAGDARLTAQARDLLLDPAHDLCFSAASIWEVAIKRALDRPDFRTDPGVLRGGLLANGYAEVPVDGRHCLPLATMPAHHGDPFDRLLIAQAQVEGMVFVTADRRLAAYGGALRMI
ncbi:type II toxin-antitoxin system VapC family toxin [Meridianimarinicoccus sp. RP-17]